MSSPAQISSYFEEANCLLCHKASYRTLIPSSYPEGASLETLQAMYSSSSETRLMDALVECRECGLIFASPRPREAVVLSSYAVAADPEFISQNGARIETFRQSALALASRYSIRKGAKFLDVGSAGGAFLKALKDLNFDAVGVEPNRWLSEFARREYSVDLRPTTLEQQRFPTSSFDVVTLWDVLEHLHDPNKMLEECRRVLKPRGLLVVNFPDYGSMASRLMGRRWPFLLSVHLYYFTRTTIQSVLSQAGFRVIDHRPHWQRLEIGYILKRAAAQIPILDKIRKAKWFRPLAPIHMPYQLGQTLTVAVRREV